MKYFSLSLLFAILITMSFAVTAGSGEAGDKCIADTQCKFGLECKDGVCIKKSAFNGGSSRKEGKPCEIDADCIGSGKCVKGSFGKSYCSG